MKILIFAGLFSFNAQGFFKASIDAYQKYEAEQWCLEHVSKYFIKSYQRLIANDCGKNFPSLTKKMTLIDGVTAKKEEMKIFISSYLIKYSQYIEQDTPTKEASITESPSIKKIKSTMESEILNFISTKGISYSCAKREHSSCLEKSHRHLKKLQNKGKVLNANHQIIESMKKCLIFYCIKNKTI